MPTNCGILLCYAFALFPSNGEKHGKLNKLTVFIYSRRKSFFSFSFLALVGFVSNVAWMHNEMLVWMDARQAECPNGPTIYSNPMRMGSGRKSKGTKRNGSGRERKWKSAKRNEKKLNGSVEREKRVWKRKTQLKEKGAAEEKGAEEGKMNEKKARTKRKCTWGLEQENVVVHQIGRLSVRNWPTIHWESHTHTRRGIYAHFACRLPIVRGIECGVCAWDHLHLILVTLSAHFSLFMMAARRHPKIRQSVQSASVTMTAAAREFSITTHRIYLFFLSIRLICAWFAWIFNFFIISPLDQCLYIVETVLKAVNRFIFASSAIRFSRRNLSLVADEFLIFYGWFCRLRSSLSSSVLFVVLGAFCCSLEPLVDGSKGGPIHTPCVIYTNKICARGFYQIFHSFHVCQHRPATQFIIIPFLWLRVCVCVRPCISDPCKWTATSTEISYFPKHSKPK